MEQNEKRFNVYTGNRNGFPMIATFDLSYKDYKNKSMYPWLLWISIPVANPRPDGLSGESDDAIMDQIEKVIEEAVKQNANIYFIGKITSNGFRDLYYYLEDAESVNMKLAELTQKAKPGEGFQYEIKKDPDWSMAVDVSNWSARSI